MERNYTIPVNQAFEASRDRPACGCPMCALYNYLEYTQIDEILGAAMMEPTIRIATNKEGFCRPHYDLMFTAKNRLGMALTLESHLAELSEEIKNPKVFAKPGEKPKKRISALEKDCYVCSRVEEHFARMNETVVTLWETDKAFREKLDAQPYFCLPHYRLLLTCGEKCLGKKDYAVFAAKLADVVEKYMATLSEDVSWFCKKFDYRYGDEPWYNSKDAVERSMRFLRADIHHPLEKLKPKEDAE